MKKARVAINGFGRIGRIALRGNLDNPLIEIVGINDLTPIEDIAYLLKRDSVYGELNHEIKKKPGFLIIDGQEIPYFNEREPENLPWQKLSVDLVLECTGFFRTNELASKHLTAGAKLVLISAPGKEEMPTFCMGVNEESFDPNGPKVVSNASCTTNALSPLVKVLDQEFGIKNATMTTIHSYTNSQNLIDSFSKKDPRRGRAAALSFFPTTTGAAEAINLVYPKAANKIHGLAIRVPSPTVSMVDLVVEVEKEVTSKEVNDAIKKRANSDLKGILDITNEPLVSIDYRGNPHSSIIDAEYTNVTGKKLVKVLAWYDNEWGYAKRLVELAAYLHKQSQ